MAIDYSWPPNGAVGWGTQVDTNLESMEARLNAIENAIADLGTNSGTGEQGPPGPTGPAGPVAIRFCINGVWQARPTTSPIINVSIGQPNAPTPPNPVEGDVWLY